jgi:hypothetical protein
MATAPASVATTGLRGRTLLDRALGVFPVVVIAFGVLVFYGVEAWTRKTPWIFTDELEWSQLSRSIAATGHAARRGEAISFKSVYSFVIAPFWWIHSTATAYAAIKYANVVIMTLAAVPTYLLARMLVSRRGALAAAVLSVSVPAMAYVTTIIVEVIAYPYYALCSWLAVRAYRSCRRRDIALAGVACLCGLLVRSPQFVTLPAAFALGGVGLFITGPRGRRLRRNWTRGDMLGALTLTLGALFLFNRVVLQHVNSWQLPTQYFKNRMVDLGLRAALSLTIGLGVLPVVAGLASLRLPERRGDPTYRAFAAWFGATLVCISLYTADKAAFLSTNFATLWEERNLIYLSPLLLIATVMVFESRRLDWRLIAAAALFVAAIVVLKPFQLEWPYFEAPGFAIPAVLSIYEHWSVHAERIALLGMLAVSLAVLGLRRRRAVAGVALVVGLSWLLAGEIANTAGIDKLANAYRANLPAQLDWVDVADRGQSATYLGQEILDPSGEWLTEFWNRSIEHVESLDGSAPGPGPATRPLVVDPTGLLSGIGGHYVLADDGVRLAATPVASEKPMVLYYSPSGRWHLLDNLEQVYSDGWCPNFCAYTYFRPHERAHLIVSLSRSAYNGTAPPGDVTVSIGTVGVTNKGVPYIRKVVYSEHVLIGDLQQKTLSFAVETPVRVVLTITHTIPPSASDPRNLGALVGFSVAPDARSG